MTSIIRNFTKLNLTLVGAGVMTLALFYLMQLLILQEQSLPQRSAFRVIGDITIPEIVIEPQRATPQPEKVEPPEPLPVLREAVLSEGPAISIPVAPPRATIDVDDFEVPGLAEGAALPLVKIPPSYPSIALQREIEGYVVLEFDVSETGQVIDPRVLYAEPENIFERAALRAVERWKYKPKIVDGRAVRMYGVQQMMTFELAD